MKRLSGIPPAWHLIHYELKSPEVNPNQTPIVYREEEGTREVGLHSQGCYRSSTSRQVDDVDGNCSLITHPGTLTLIEESMKNR